MATGKPTWTEAVSIRSAATLAAAGTAGYDIDMDTLGADASKLQINLTIGSSSGITVEIFDSPDSGTTDDDVPVITFQMTASGIKSITIKDTPHYRVLVTNDDGSNATGNLAIQHAWRQWSIA